MGKHTETHTCTVTLNKDRDTGKKNSPRDLLRFKTTASPKRKINTIILQSQTRCLLLHFQYRPAVKQVWLAVVLLTSAFRAWEWIPGTDIPGGWCNVLAGAYAHGGCLLHHLCSVPWGALEAEICYKCQCTCTQGWQHHTCTVCLYMYCTHMHGENTSHQLQLAYFGTKTNKKTHTQKKTIEMSLMCHRGQSLAKFLWNQTLIS